MSLLQYVGNEGANNLKQILTTCTDPIDAITNFQVENSIKCASLPPALKLLDLLSVSRLEYHSAALAALKEKLISRIRDLANSNSDDKTSLTKLNSLVIKSFPFVNIVHLRPVVLEALKLIPKLPEQFLSQVRRDESLYRDVAVKVKQQIWLEDDDLFLEEVI